MIIEIGEGIMMILVITTILTFLVMPEMVFLVVILGVFSVIAFSTTGQELTIKSKDRVILQLNKLPDTNTTKIDTGKDK